MLRFVITLFFVGTCVANLDNLWTTFKSLHKRNYSAKEDSLRKSIFESSIKHVNEHNLHYDLGLSSYRLGLNKFADMTSDEFLQYKGFKFNASAVASTGSSQSIVSADNLPTKVDWRDKGYVTPVKNQKQCGSCWAFSATGALEGANAAKTGTLVSLSEQQLVDCSHLFGNHGCKGGMPDRAFMYTIANRGLVTEENYPYTATDGACKLTQGQEKTTCIAYFDIRSGDELALQAAVAMKGPVSVAIDASHPSFRLYDGGVYDEHQCSSSEIDHAVLAVGYGIDKGNAYWLVKNSWDSDWGEQGYIRMSRNKHNQCGIASYASYPIV